MPQMGEWLSYGFAVSGGSKSGFSTLQLIYPKHQMSNYSTVTRGILTAGVWEVTRSGGRPSQEEVFREQLLFHEHRRGQAKTTAVQEQGAGLDSGSISH